MTHKVKWAASLSNGETVYEDKGNYKIIEKELSPWRRLLAHLEKQGAFLTSISLYTDKGQRWNLPSAGTNPKFKAFCDAEKPTGYNFFRKIGADVIGQEVENQEIYTIIEAIYSNKKLQVWVSETNPEICWSVIV